MKGNIQSESTVVSGVKPIVISPTQDLIAIDGTNGEEIWRFQCSKGVVETFGGYKQGALLF